MTTRAGRGRWTVSGILLALGLVLVACGSSAHKAALPKPTVRSTTTTSTTTTTTAPPTTAAPPATTPTTQPKKVVLAVVPDVIGLRITAARDALTAAHLRPVSLNRACSKGTLASQSVVDSVALPGPAPNFALGARPLAPGSYVPAHALVGMAWSGCFGGGTAVPAVVGLTFGAARQDVVRAGLTWTCQDQSTTTTVPLDRTVLSQNPAAGTPEVAAALVTFVMARCPATSP
jgi:PASTA domain